MKVKTPKPSLKRRYAPKETRAQNGSCVENGSLVDIIYDLLEGKGAGMKGNTYDWDDLGLDQTWEGNQLEVESEVELPLLLAVCLFYTHGVLVSDDQKVVFLTEETRRAREMVCWAFVMIA